MASREAGVIKHCTVCSRAMSVKDGHDTCVMCRTQRSKGEKALRAKSKPLDNESRLILGYGFV